MTLSMPINLYSPWPHRWAWALACATFPLVWWGGFVTATGSGMAFREWLTPDGSLMPFYPWFSSVGDKFIEHGHRLLAMAVGVLTIGLVIATVRREPRTWVRAYSVALLASVVGQGVLGGARVVLNERVLALVHGCVGPLFLAACAGMVVITSPRWQAACPDGEAISTPRRRTLLRMAIVTAVLAYLQLVLGALVRHSPYMLRDDAGVIFQFAVYAHVATALIVVAQTLRLAFASWRRPAPRGLTIAVAGMALFQILLGFSSWIVKYGMPLWFTQLVGETGHFNRASDMISAAIVTAHGATGALIVALTVAAALDVGRYIGVPWRHGSAFAGREALA